MKRTIGIILIIAGVVLAIFTFNQHEKDRTIIDLGEVEIKAKDQSHSQNTTLYYVMAAVCMIGGGIIALKKKV